MLIRGAQMQTLSDGRAASFGREMVGHLQRCFPAECEAMGDDGVRETIRIGIEKARSYGITAAREVCLYIDVMMVFGCDFDRDPKLPWAASILSGRRWKDPAAKVDRLFRTAQEHYSQAGRKL
jgi:hypothetical protein